MEGEKRSRKLADLEVVSLRQKHKKACYDTAVNENEVEEFFAILRRMHAAVNYFKKQSRGRGGGGKFTEGGSQLLRVMLESDEGKDGVKLKGKRNVGFDLNADPDPECDPPI